MARKPGPRLANDLNQYIRCIPAKGEGGRPLYQARPYDLGVRYDLGLFPTEGEARRAIREFWWSKRESLPRFTRRVRRRGRTEDGGEAFVYVALKPGGGSLGTWPSRELAALRALMYVVTVAHQMAETEVIRSVPSPDDPPRDVREAVRERAAEIVGMAWERRELNGPERERWRQLWADRRARDRAEAGAQKAERARVLAEERAAVRAAKYAAQLAKWRAWQAGESRPGPCPTHPDQMTPRQLSSKVRVRTTT